MADQIHLQNHAAQGGQQENSQSKGEGTFMTPPAFQLKASSASEAIQRKTGDKTKEFQSKKYDKKNFQPSTGMGLFDVNLNPFTGRLEVKVKVGFTFADGDGAAFKGLKDQSQLWGKEEKLKWKNDFITLIEGRWGGKYTFSNPDLPGISSYVDIEVEEVTKDWHYSLSVKKIPKGQPNISSTTTYKGSSLNKNSADLDSEDMKWVDKNARKTKPNVTEKQMGAIHEFGHMIGLDDEYANDSSGIRHASLVQNALGKTISEGDTNNIMSNGNHIEKQNYVTFLDALNSVTGMSNWKFNDK